MIMCVHIKFKFCILVSIIFYTPNLFCNEPICCKISNEIVTSISEELEKEGLYIYGSGGVMMNELKKVEVWYLSLAKMDVDQARKLYVTALEEYLKKYNESKEIRPFLHKFPFTVENIKMTIVFENESQTHQGEGFVAYILRGKNNQIFYEGYDHKTEKLYDIYSEPYEKALEIVRNQKVNSF